MKLIFLDVDGVLNSMEYFCAHEGDADYADAFVDPAAVRRLGQLVRRSGAEVILSSSWREGWDRDPAGTHPSVMFLNKALAEERIQIRDKTPYFGSGKRSEEILYTLGREEERIESFVILDDADYQWDLYGMKRRWVQTDFENGGLKDEHVQGALEILAEPVRFLEKIRLAWYIWRLNMRPHESSMIRRELP